MMKKWKLRGIAALLLLALTVAGCSGTPPADSAPGPVSTPAQIAFVDSLNHEVVLKDRPARTVSLMGSYSEAWVLAGGMLAGTTDDAVTERKMELGENVSIIGKVKEPSLEKILSLSPDFVILSAELQPHLELDAALQKAGIAHAYFRVNSFAEYLRMMEVFTDLTDRADLYQKNGLDVQEQVEAVLSRVDKTKKKPAVLFVRASSQGVQTQKDDTMTGAMLRELNCENIADRYPSLLQDLSMEEIIRADPDYIFATTMGSSTQQALDSIHKKLQSNPAWEDLSAVKQGRYIVLPKDLFQYKPNSRWGEAYEYLEKILYPDSAVAK